MRRSFTLMQVVEDHWEELADSAVRQIISDPEMRDMRKIPEFELRSRVHEVLKNMGLWLSGESDVWKRYEQLGHHRHEQGIPLHELVRGLITIKEKMIDFIRSQGAETATQLFAEEQLEHTVNRFFDR